MYEELLKIWIYIKWSLGQDLAARAKAHKIVYGKGPNRIQRNIWRQQSLNKAFANGGVEYNNAKTVIRLTALVLCFGGAAAGIIILLLCC